MFHQLINRQRKTNLHVHEVTYTGTERVAHGFKEYFQALAKKALNPTFDEEYHRQVTEEVEVIHSLVAGKDVPSVTLRELDETITSINKGKAADVYGLTVEHFLYAGDEARNLLINSIFEDGSIPASLKIGLDLLTPIFKIKGSNLEASSYRGITVLPVLEKIIEAVLKGRISHIMSEDQSSFRRGFTSKTSPLHAALIVEEVTRDSKDAGIPINLVFLDAKSAFDVVDHAHLPRRAFHSGVQDKHWLLLRSIHSQSTRVIKWTSLLSQPFDLDLGVRQGDP